MAEKSLLRRWKRFLPAFSAIDAAIEAAPEGHSRDKFRQVRGDLVEMLCDAAGSDDDERAEALCRLLDEAMVEALETLRVAAVAPIVLIPTGVDKAVRDLQMHESRRVRGLACSIIAVWRASIEGDMSMRRAALENLSSAPSAAVHQGDKKQAAKTQEPVRHEKTCPGVSTAAAAAGDDRVRSEQTETGDAKRKYHGPRGPGGYYREADEEKRQRRVREDREKGDHERPRKMHPDSKERSRASCWRSTEERRFSTSLRHRF